MHQIPLGYYPFKGNLAVPTGQRKLTSVGVEPTTSGLDFPMLYRLSHEANTGAGLGNLGCESR